MSHHTHHHHHTESTMSFDKQLKTLFDHWIKHNDSHAGTYREWAAKARDNHMEETASLLEEIARMTEAVSSKIEEAATSVK